MSRRSPGEHVLLRQLNRGRIWTAFPAAVIEDAAERVVLWMPGAATGRAARGELFGDWALEERSWRRRGDLVRVAPVGRAHSILHFRHADGSFRGWYVNLESPLARTPLGWDFDDHVLDLWVDPDGSWRWLDEDELEAGLAAGALAPADAATARAEGERVLAEWPFPTGWEHWRPPADWALPRLPADWNRL